MKPIVKGFIAVTLFAATVFIPVSATGGIKSATFNSNKMVLNGFNLNLGGQRMVWIVKDGEENASNYMPVRGVLEAMGYTVSWDAEKKTVIVTSPLYGEKPQVPRMTDTIPPTKELLNGAWTTIYSEFDNYPEDPMKYYFNPNGTYVTHEDRGFSPGGRYDGGTYSLDGDVISMTLEFRNQQTLNGSVTTKQCRFSKDGSIMYMQDSGSSRSSYITVLVRDDGAEFAGKVDGFVPKGIKSAEFNSNKVILDGKELDLGGQQMIWVVKEGEQNASNYMPVRGVLEAMGYGVSWDGYAKAVLVSYGSKPDVPEHSEEEMISPTKELLNGYWVATKYYYNGYYKITGDYTTAYGNMKYYFDLNGNFAYYTHSDDKGYSNYGKGTYTIDEDGVAVKITYMIDRDGKKMAFTGDNTIEISLLIGFSEDGSKMYATDLNSEDVLIVFVKDAGEEFKKYQ